MSQQRLQYNPSECLSTACGACLNNCPIGCIKLEPFTITPDCIECEQCINNCPKSEKVLRLAYNHELGGGWISPFGYKAESSTESKGDSSASKKDNEQESSQESNKGESKGDSSTGQNPVQDSSYTPADKAKLEALKNALLSAPPPTRYNQAQRL